MDRLGPLLKRMLRQRLISQSAFARQVGLSSTAINKILHDRMAPRPKRAEAWCKALNLSPEDAKRLTLAICLAAAAPPLRSYVAALERRSGGARNALGNR